MAVKTGKIRGAGCRTEIKVWRTPIALNTDLVTVSLKILVA